MDMGNKTMGMQMESVSKQVFTLEEVNDALTYSSVKERTLTKTAAAIAGKSDIKAAGKGESVFDLKDRMRIDLTIKSRSKVALGAIPGVSNDKQELYQIRKFRMEKK